MNAAQLQELCTAWPGTWTESPTEPGVYELTPPPGGWAVYAHLNPRGSFVVGAERQIGELIIIGTGRKAEEAVKSFRDDSGQTTAALGRLQRAIPSRAIPAAEDRDSDTLPEPMAPHARAYYMERARMFPGRSGE